MIRDAQPTDAKAICDIWNPIIRDTTITFTTTPKAPADIADLISERPFFVLELNNQIAGFATYGPFRNGPGYLRTMEHSIMMAEGSRAKGQAAALMDRLKTHAKSKKVHSLIAGMAGQNAPAITFHAKHGFQHVAHIPQAGWKFDTWHDLILMQYTFS